MRRALERTRYEDFEAFFLAHERRLRAFALRRTRSTHLADDLVAEVMEIAWRRFDAIPQERAFGWLCRVAINVESNQRRSMRRRATVERRAANEARPTALTVELDDERIPPESRLALAEAWDSLTVDEQLVLSLAAWESLTTAELAEALGVSEVAARKRLSRARSRLYLAFGPSRAGSEGSDD